MAHTTAANEEPNRVTDRALNTNPSLLDLPAEVRSGIHQHLARSSDVAIGTTPLLSRMRSLRPQAQVEPNGCRLHYVNRQLRRDFLYEAARGDGRLHIFANRSTIKQLWHTEQNVEGVGFLWIGTHVLELPSDLTTHFNGTVKLDFSGCELWSFTYYPIPNYTRWRAWSLLPPFRQAKTLQMVGGGDYVLDELRSLPEATKALIEKRTPGLNTLWFHDTSFRDGLSFIRQLEYGSWVLIKCARLHRQVAQAAAAWNGQAFHRRPGQVVLEQFIATTVIVAALSTLFWVLLKLGMGSSALLSYL